MIPKTIHYLELGLVPYREALVLQENLRAMRISGKVDDHILLLEHPPVFTIGKRDSGADFLSTRETIAAEGIDIVKTDRGGKITYHGPGQLVCYFICGLEGLGYSVKEFVAALEELSIEFLSGYGISASRDGEYPGIWIGKNKIVAIGLHISEGVTMHGIAININCDLKPYRHICACGIKDRGVTSMLALIKRDIDMADAGRKLREAIASQFKVVLTAAMQR